MIRLTTLLPILLLGACKPAPDAATSQAATQETDILMEVRSSVVRVNSTLQEWSPWQPWEKEPPTRRRALAAIIGPRQVITTAEMAANSTYIEFESSDGTRFIPAKVIARDDEANLALLGPADPQQGDAFFENTKPFEVASPTDIGETLEILQLEANGVAIQTPGTLQSVDLSGSFLPGQFFLTYLVKASMQSAASSYSLPVLKGHRLAGVLVSYNSKDQICDVVSTDILSRFLDEARAENYVGFPSLGVRVSDTEDTSFRQWLKLPEDAGGLYIQAVRKGTAADAAGLLAGDVILGVDGHPIDRRGYYSHPQYGSVSWSHLVRGEKSVGDPLSLTLWRDGSETEVTAQLTREEEHEKLVPDALIDEAPDYLLKGGLIFQELTRNNLVSFGKDWMSRAPLNLLDAYENPDKYQDRMRRVVYLSGVIPTPATIGYERLRNLIVKQVNGQPVRDMASLVDAFDRHGDKLHSIEFIDENLVVHLDNRISDAVDNQLLQRGITSLSRVTAGPAAQEE